MTASLVVAGLALAIWLYLLAFRGGFWLARERDDGQLPSALPPGGWPSVTAVIPARNEADMIPQGLGSLLAQHYAGDLRVVLVDDQSSDGTADVARRTARRAGGADRLRVIAGKPLPAGWTGKLWAVHQGIAAATDVASPPRYLLLTDADIGYDPDALTRLVARAEASGNVLTSLMVKLRCQSLAERLLIPAFVFFFAMLYPFAWINDRRRRTAGAAGGTMLVERRALEAAGGVASMRGALIDDCTLAGRLKAVGPVWLGLTEKVISLRPYPAFGDIRRMVARSAYAQLRYSPLLLAGTVVAMAITYLAPPLLALLAPAPSRWLAAAASSLMILAFLPFVRFYRLSAPWALALPAIALIYLAFTLDSAYQHWRGRGGMWKGRAQALADKAGTGATAKAETR